MSYANDKYNVTLNVCRSVTLTLLYRWLDTGEDDQEIVRELTVTEVAMEGEKPSTPKGNIPSSYKVMHFIETSVLVSRQNEN